MINNNLASKISIKRGVRQGCPLSMILFMLGSIQLIEMIKDNINITGHITKCVKPIQSYADDMIIIINTPNEIDKIIQIFDKHGKASEAKINKDKTQAFVLGRRFTNEPDSFF